MKYFYYEEFCLGLPFMVEAESFEEAEELAFNFIIKYAKDYDVECPIYQGKEVEDSEWYECVYKVNKDGYTLVEYND